MTDNENTKPMKTLDRIMKYWTEPIVGAPVAISLPFNIENFCRENDEAYEKLLAENKELKNKFYQSNKERAEFEAKIKELEGEG